MKLEISCTKIVTCDLVKKRMIMHRDLENSRKIGVDLLKLLFSQLPGRIDGITQSFSRHDRYCSRD
jgi:hypothetical protein